MQVHRILDRIPRFAHLLRRRPTLPLLLMGARITAVRYGLWRYAATRAPRPKAGPSPLFRDLDVTAACAVLDAHGFCGGLDLPPALVREIRDFAEQTPCYGNFDRGLAFLPAAQPDWERRSGRPIIIGHYFEQISRCGAIGALCADPALRGLAAAYLHARPRLIRARLWWSFPSADAHLRLMHLASQSYFHADIDDWRSLKFFFYLTDVDGEAGPHRYIRGSHRRKSLAHQLSLTAGKSPQQIARVYRPDDIITVHGAAGTGFAEDPFVFHTGTRAGSRRRLMLEIHYGISAPVSDHFFGEPIPRGNADLAAQIACLDRGVAWQPA